MKALIGKPPGFAKADPIRLGNLTCDGKFRRHLLGPRTDGSDAGLYRRLIAALVRLYRATSHTHHRPESSNIIQALAPFVHDADALKISSQSVTSSFAATARRETTSRPKTALERSRKPKKRTRLKAA